ncbi:MAG: carboxypeptidase regulatory-like domain-containing protein [Planctomycetaceae bacterium]|nr:carboxypeptidase regulatory-like domain-containing protein [Planctomycetaceae bacterium]
MNPFALVNRLLGRFGRPFHSPLERRIPRHVRLEVQQLEERRLFAVDLPSYDGTGNNLLHTDWGAAGTDFIRIAAAQYADGVDDPSGADRPSARLISEAIFAHPSDDVINDRDLSAFIYAWGQFLDHGIDLTLTQTPAESFNIAVPTGDPYFDPAGSGKQVIPLSRSIYDSATGTSSANPRQQINSISAFIDGSQVYGSDAATAASLRTFSGGRLKTSDGNLLPTAADGSFLAGDIRVNENVELISMQTLFLREHNRLADQIAKADPKLTDEQIYQQARRIVVAELQVITYNEFIPALLGKQLKAYTGYHADVNPGISNEFATAAFRIGHSMLGGDVEFLDNNGNEIRDAISLREAFFNPNLVKETGIDPILKYLASDRAEEIDTKVVDDIRNFLFGAPGQGGLDLASLNIQRGRDHGLPDYNSLRAAYGLAKVTSFAQITPDKALQDLLRQTYGSVDKIDAWVGGLAEKHVPGGSVGELFSRIIADQFTRLRDGDRFWYQNTLNKDQVRQVEQTTLADVVRRNTTVSSLQQNVFFLKTSISGTVFNDANQNGARNPNEQGLAGVTVRLLDAGGFVVAQTLTDAQGNYSFRGLDLGKYRVEEQTPSGVKTTSSPVIDTALTRGMDVQHLDFGLIKVVAKPTAPPPTTKPTAPPPPPPPMKTQIAAVGSVLNNAADTKKATPKK